MFTNELCGLNLAHNLQSNYINYKYELPIHYLEVAYSLDEKYLYDLKGNLEDILMVFLCLGRCTRTYR